MSNEVDIKISENGSKVVIRDFGNLAKASDKAETSVKALKATLDTLKGFSLKNLITQSNNLATALGSLNKGAAELNSLKNAFTGLANSGTQLNKLKTTLDSFGNSTSGLGVLYNTLKSLATTSNNLVRLNQHLVALPPLIAHIHALSAAIATLVSHNGALATLATNLRNLAANNTGITNLRTAISGLSTSMAALVAQANAIARALQNLNGAAGRASGGLFNLRSSLMGISGLMIASQVREWLDAWQSAAGLFKVATESLEEMRQVQEQVTQVARETRQEFTPTVELYARLKRASEDLGSSQNEMIKFTKGVNTVLAIQHTSSSQARGALMQLGQAMGLGRIRAQEFNSMNENLYLVLKTVAKNMDGTGGSVVALRQKMLAGKLMSKEFFEAFLKGIKDLEKDFGKTSVTISQSFSVMNTNFIQFLGKLDDAVGFSNAFGKSVIFLSENLAILLPLVAFSAILFAGTFIPALAGTAANMNFVSASAIFLQAQLARLWLVMAANPTAATLAVLAALAIGITSVKDSIVLGTTEFVKFNGKLVESKATFGDFLSVLKEDISNLFGAFGMVFGDFIEQFEIGKKLKSFFDDNTLAGFLRSFAYLLDYAGAAIRTFLNLMGEFVSTMFSNLLVVVDKTIGFLAKGLNVANEVVVAGINKIREKVGKEPLIPIKVFDEEVFAKGINNLQNIGKPKGQQTPYAPMEFKGMDWKGIGNYNKDQISGIDDPNTWNFSNTVEDQIKRAGEKRKALLLEQLKAEDALNKKHKGAPVIDPDAEAKLRKVEKEYERILAVIDPIGSAQRKMKEELAFIVANAKTLKLDKQDIARITLQIKEHYKDAIDPLGKMTREYNEQLKLLRMMPQQRREELEVMRQIEELRKSGGKVTPKIEEQFRKNAKDKFYQEDVGSIRDDVMESYRKKRQEPLLTEKAYNDVLQDPNIKDPKKAILDKEMQANPDMFKGTQEQMDAQAQSWEMMYRKIDFLRQNDIISEQTAAYQKSLIDKEIRDQKLKGTRDLFDGLATLQDSGSKTAFRIGKAASIANATMNMYDAISAAYKAPPGWPLNAPSVIGVTVAQASNLAKIRSVGFMTGGSFDVTGSGGHDSQTVAFRASPGERVSVQTPQQYRKGDPNGNGSGGQQKAPENNIRVVNLLDPAIVGDYMATPDGEKVFINMIERNQAQIRQLVR